MKTLVESLFDKDLYKNTNINVGGVDISPNLYNICIKTYEWIKKEIVSNNIQLKYDTINGLYRAKRIYMGDDCIIYEEPHFKQLFIISPETICYNAIVDGDEYDLNQILWLKKRMKEPLIQSIFASSYVPNNRWYQDFCFIKDKSGFSPIHFSKKCGYMPNYISAKATDIIKKY